MLHKILIDGCQVNQSPRGMGLYTHDIIQALSGVPIIIVSNNQFFRKNLEDFHPLTRLIYLKLPSIIIEQVVVPILIRKYSISRYISAGDSCSVIASFFCSTTIVLHDVYFTNPLQKKLNSVKRDLGKIYRRLTIAASVKNNVRIITVSKFTAMEILSTYNITKDTISIIGNKLRYSCEDVPKIERNILLVTGDDPQKNVNWTINTLLDAEIWGSIEKISIVGISSANQVGLRDNRKIEYLGYLDNNLLEDVYKSSKLLLMPSLHESFGVPIIEAFSKSCSVCAASSAAFPEIGGEFAHYFALDDKNSLLTAITAGLEEKIDIKAIRMHLEQYTEANFNYKIITELS